jgi:regulator of sigma E protease
LALFIYCNLLFYLTLAVINIVPFPALDGGRLMFLLIEKFRGKPVNQKIEGIIHGVGFYLLLLLLIAISIRDIQKFEIGSKIGNFFQGIF